MYFIHTETLKLVRIDDPAKYLHQYIILSHTWGDDEVLFDDLQAHQYQEEIEDLQTRLAALESYVKAKVDGEQSKLDRNEPDESRTNLSVHKAKKKKGWAKIEGCCKEAAKYNISLVWIDTCCINKHSSAELSEAINSMFAWYRDAKLCLAYLGDVLTNEEERLEVEDDPTAIPKESAIKASQFAESRWFTRGWTLQELIAPKEVFFFDRNWELIGTRTSHAKFITLYTGIDQSVLNGNRLEKMAEFSVATRLSWAAKRQVTREEDHAYSLMGLFAVHIPIIYGEGERSAFFRLQQEIFNMTGDHSIFMWASLPYPGQDPYHFYPTPPLGSESAIKSRDIDEGKVSGSHQGNLMDLFANSVAHFRGYLPLQNAPYNTSDQFPSLRKVKVTSRFTSAANGIRSQFLVQVIKERPGHTIFIAYPACKLISPEGKLRLFAIYLVFRRPGQYLRLHPDRILVFEQHTLSSSHLTLEDAYIVKTPVSGPKTITRQVEHGASLHIEITVVDEGLSDSGFDIHTEENMHWTVQKENDPWGKPIHSMLFNSASMIESRYLPYHRALPTTNIHTDYSATTIFRNSSTADEFTIIIEPHRWKDVAFSLRTEVNEDEGIGLDLKKKDMGKSASKIQAITEEVVTCSELQSGRRIFVTQQEDYDPDDYFKLEEYRRRYKVRIVVKKRA